MPEGHLIHRVADEHNRTFANQRTIIQSPQGRFTDGADELNGRTLRSVLAHGKHLFYRFSGNRILHIHLGLYGKFRSFSNPPTEPKGQVRLRVIGKTNGFDLNGPNQCRLITKSEFDQLRNRLGPDPLCPSSNGKVFVDKATSSQSPIGALLLDQSVIAGIGNIYRTEILFLAKINPQTSGNALSDQKINQIWKLSRDLLAIGKQQNRIITAGFDRDFTKRSPRSERFNIYKKPECPECGEAIYYWELANRTVYACESCQPYEPA